MRNGTWQAQRRCRRRVDTCLFQRQGGTDYGKWEKQRLNSEGLEGSMHRIQYAGIIVLRNTMTAPTQASEGILNEVQCKGGHLQIRRERTQTN